MPEVKCKFSLRFAIKRNKYVYWTKVQPLVCICCANLIQIKIHIRSDCYENIAYYCNFRNLNIKLQENCMVKEKSDHTNVLWRPL